MDEEPRSIVEIDKYRLDVELVQQPVLYEEYARRLEEAKADVEEAKNILRVKNDDYDVAWAEMDLKVRQDPEDFGIVKPAESSYKSAVLISKEVEVARKEVQKARSEIVRLQKVEGALNAMVGALEQKKACIEKLCALRLSSYYAEPKLPKGKEGDYKSEAQDKKRRRMYDEIRNNENNKNQE